MGINYKELNDRLDLSCQTAHTDLLNSIDIKSTTVAEFTVMIGISLDKVYKLFLIKNDLKNFKGGQKMVLSIIDIYKKNCIDEYRKNIT